jgi:hypothetical protein
VEAALTRCDAVRSKRNRLVHSASVFLEAGDELVGVMRSDIFRGEGPDGLTFDQEMLTASSFTDLTRELALLTFEVGQCHVQLRHWV